MHSIIYTTTEFNDIVTIEVTCAWTDMDGNHQQSTFDPKDPYYYKGTTKTGTKPSELEVTVLPVNNKIIFRTGSLSITGAKGFNKAGRTLDPYQFTYKA